MRHVCLAVAAVGLSILVPSGMLGQGPSSGLSITNYQLVGEQRVSGTQSYFTYRADLLNAGVGRSAVTATATSSTPGVQVIQGNLHFTPVPANGRVTSTDTFVVLVDRTVPLSLAGLQWTFSGPFANAGPNQTARVGSTVTLNGSGSSSPSVAGFLTYDWTFLSRPAAASTSLSSTRDVLTSFTVDAPGTYVIKLTVNNGMGSDSAIVAISTANSPPVASAGPNQTTSVGSTVLLNGSGSSDVDGGPLTYLWTLASRPSGSAAALTGATSVSPSFVPDKPGSYIAQLVVSDGSANSTPSTVTVATQNTAPVASAGSNRVISTSSPVQLNGSGSTDVDGDSLTYSWSLITKPSGSASSLSGATGVNPTFIADVEGTYVAQLIVSDGTVGSIPATVVLTTNAVQAPSADAGPDQTVKHGSLVALSGSGTDPQDRPLTLRWSLVSRPAGSAAVLSSSVAAQPTFIADVPGDYVAQLQVNNGFASSSPATVKITTTNTAPVANAGSTQPVAVGSTVTINGITASDADGDPLNYSFALTTRPSGSTAALLAPNSPSPTFTPDVPGTYVVQLIVKDKFASSSPATAVITADATTITVTPEQLNLSANSPGTLTVSVGAPAGPGGLQVKLTAFDPAVVTFPGTVTIPEGATSAPVVVTPNTIGSTLIVASMAGFRPGTATVVVSAASLSLSLSSSFIGITRTATGTITLSAPAPAGGAVVTLIPDLPGIVSLQPASFSIAAGQTTGTFTITGIGDGNTLITASASGYGTAGARITVSRLGLIALQPNVAVGPGQSTPIEVTLLTPAPVGGVTITLNSSNPSILTVTPSVVIPQGATTPTTQPLVTGVAFGTASITASASGFTGDTESVTVAANLTLAPASITLGSGATQNLTLTLSSPAPAGGLSVALKSSNTSVATVPASVVIAPNTTTAVVPVSASGPGSATITATPSSASVVGATAGVTVVTFGTINMPASVTLGLGQTTPAQISLSGNAPAGGVTISLVSSNPSRVTVSPATITIPAGSNAPAVQPIITGVSLGSATITASAPGFGSATQSVQVTLSSSLAPQNLSITGSATQNLTLTLSSPAPSGGLIINLSSDNPAVASVPATVTIAQNATTATVPVTGVGSGSTIIRAGAPNLTQATANVTVQTAGVINVPAAIALAPGQSAAFPISLSAPAPNNVTVTLTSNNPARVTVSPATVVILAGQTQPAQQPQVQGVGFGSANITASAPGYTSGTQVVQVGATLAFAAAPVTIPGTATQNVLLTLSAPAPAGGLLVNLASSSPGVASVPASVTIGQGATSVNVPVTGVGAGSATITASSSAPNIVSATKVVAVQAVGGGISLPAGVTVMTGQSVAFPVTLSIPAPAGGVTVTLSSSDTSKVTIAPLTVTVAAGQTQPAQQPQVTGVSLGTANITASAPNYGSSTRAVQVTGTIGFSPSTISIIGTATQNLTLTLSAPAPAGGLTVNLSSNSAAVATVPATVTFAANSTTATVPITGVTPGSAVITATASGVGQATANVTVRPLADIILPTDLVVAPGDFATFNVSLARPAQTTVFVALTSSDPSKATLSVQSAVFSAGQTQPLTQPRINGISPGQVTITASALGLTTATTTVVVGYRISFVPATLTVTGTNTQSLTLTLSHGAPQGGLTVNLSSSNTNVAKVPASVSFGPNATTVSVPVTGVAPGTAVISAASAGMPDATANVTVVNPGTIMLPANPTVGLGGMLVLPITLSSPAPAGGVVVTLSSNNSSRLTIAPTTVTVAGGQTQPAVQPKITGVNVGPATITASAPGYSSASTTVQVTASVAFTQGPVTIRPGNTANLLLALSASAPWVEGVTVKLSSSNPAAVTVQGEITFYPDGSEFTTLIIPVVGVAPGTAVISAVGLNIPQATTTVTVLGPVSITTTSLPSGSVGSSYSQSLAATGGSQPYTFALISGTLPAGLNFNSSGQITGTPTAVVSNAQLTFRVTESSSAKETATRTLSLTIGAQVAKSITVTSGSGQSAPIGTAFASRLVATVRDASNNPVPGVTVTFAAPSSGASGSFAGGATTAVTNASGVATSALFTANNTQGAYVVTASAPGVPTSASFSLTNTSGSAASIAATSGTPQTATINTAFASPLVATVKDAGGNPVSGVTVTFNVPSTGARGTFAGGTNTAVTNASGVATSAIFTANNTAGAYTVTASVSGVSTPASFALTNRAGAAASITATGGSGQSAAINAVYANPLTATVKDSGGNPVSGVTVTFTLPTTGARATFAGGVNTAVTNASGVATSAVLTANATAGPFTVTASAAGVSTPASFNLTNTAAAPASITATSGSGQSANVNAAFSAPLVATVKDSGGNPVSGATVTFTAPASGASGTFAGGANTAVTNASGVATSVVFTSNGTPGAFSVTASVAGVATPASFSLTNTPRPAASIAATGGTPQSAQVGAAFGSPLQATVKDVNGNPVSGVTVTFSVPSSGASGSFAGGATTAVTNASGVATSAILTANNTVGGFTATASVAGVQSTASFSLTNTARPPASITATGGTPQSAQVNTAFSSPLIATVKDANGNGVGGVTVTFVAPSSGASGSFAGGVNTAVTNSSGVATSTAFTANGTAGAFTVAASVSGVSTPANFSLTNTPRPAASITATGGTPQSALTGAAFGSPLVATVKDANGNGVSGVTVTFTAPASGASGSFAGGATTAVTNASGVATSATFTANNTAGAYVVNASVAGVQTPASFSLTNSQRPPSSIVVTSGSGQSTAVNTAFSGRLVATVRDSNGNPVNGVTVTFTPPSGGAGGSFAGGVNTAVTNASGVATSAVFNANGVVGTYNVAASVAGVQTAANFTLSNILALAISSATVGKNLQVPLTVTLPSVAPAGGQNVTITSGTPGQLLIAGRPGDTGVAQLVVKVPEGLNTVGGIYAQALSDSGAVQVTVSAPGFNSGIATVTLAPSGVVLAGPAGTVGTDFSLTQGSSAQLTVSTARLDSSLKFVEFQQVRGDFSVTVAITNSGSSQSSVTPSSVTIVEGDADSTTTFKANSNAVGTATLTASVPAGFSQPAQGANDVTATFLPSGLSAPGVAVGQNLQTTGSIVLNSPAPSPFIVISITSSDPTAVLFSTTPDELGSGSIELSVPGGRTSSPQFYIQGLRSSGSIPYTATAPGFGTATGIVTLTPSGFVISGPLGFGGDLFTTTGAENSLLNLYSARLDAAGNYVAPQSLRGGLSASINVSSGTPSVGTIIGSPVVFTGGGSTTGSVQFDPVGFGATVISLSTPAGFSSPLQYASLTANVRTPSVAVTDGIRIGKNLQAVGIVLLGEAAGAGGVPVTLTSNSPAQLLLSNSASAAGSPNITVTVPAGQSSAVYYLQVFDDSGVATYTATAPGYAPKSGTVQMGRSGVLIAGPFGFGFQLVAPKSAGAKPVSIYTALLNANDEYETTQQLAGGLSLQAELTSGDPGVGTVSNSVTISGGSESGVGQFVPVDFGNTVLTVVQPDGYTPAARFTTVLAVVN